MTEKELKEWEEFIYNPENEGNCDNCPENMGFSSWQNRKPCGGWNCWVRLHCKETNRE